MLDTINKLLNALPISLNNTSLLSQSIAVLFIIVLAMASFYIVKYGIVHALHLVIGKTKSDLDDVLIKRRVFGRVALLAPALVIYKLIPQALIDSQLVTDIIKVAALIYIVIVVAMIIDSLIDSLLEIYRNITVARHLPVQSFAQVIKLIIYFVAIILVVSLLVGQSPFKLFAGLGAMAAILMLVFKDPILGFAAGIQLSYNKMVALGDWVEIPQHSADGDIMEIGLTTVKVRNFDHTITTVPTQSLINESFKNWRGMQQSAGRRIKRSLHIDLNSVRFCTPDMLNRYRQINAIRDYVDNKNTELNEYNENQSVNVSDANGRSLTNIGTFRAYILAYLRQHPHISQHLTLIVRQLAPTQTGLPLEIYAFSTEKNWAKYEAIQADIFDHLLAVAQTFDLRIYQQPAGSDLIKLQLPTTTA